MDTASRAPIFMPPQIPQFYPAPATVGFWATHGTVISIALLLIAALLVVYAVFYRQLPAVDSEADETLAHIATARAPGLKRALRSHYVHVSGDSREPVATDSMTAESESSGGWD